MKRHEKLKKYAEELEDNLPRSERWFRKLYNQHFRSRHDHFNKPLNLKYIPDLVNFKYKYIIEIDGTIHDLEEVSKNDIKKDKYYQSKGFKVFRLKAYDEIGYINLIHTLIDVRGRTEFPLKKFSEFKKAVTA